MSAVGELFRRDLGRPIREIRAFEDGGGLWATLPGAANSAGNLALHLEGNLREYVGRQLGGIPYVRDRPLEFSATGLSVADVALRLETLPESVCQVVAALTPEALDAIYPEPVLGTAMTTRHFLIHLLGHLTYHLGQINYLRRVLTA